MTGKYCILNGELTESSDARISPYDRGFMYGDGVFDTMSALKGVPFLFDEHIKRLYENLNNIEITLPYTSGGIHKMITSLIEKNGLSNKDSYVRTTVTRGLNAGTMFYPSKAPTLFITAAEVSDSVKDIRDNGIKCVISESQKLSKNPLNEIKSLNFLWSVMGAREAHRKGADECIFFNDNGFLAEGTTCNVFIVKDKAISTPTDDAGILPGITRGYLIGLLDAKGVTVTKKDITKDELMDADEVFITSSIRGVVPVISIGDKVFKKACTEEIQNIYFMGMVVTAQSSITGSNDNICQSTDD
jgi:branched-chain amino acid aminotransferase